MIPHKLCDGLGMACCYTCGSNADNFPEVVPSSTFRPNAAPERGRCADWRAMPDRHIPARKICAPEDAK